MRIACAAACLVLGFVTCSLAMTVMERSDYTQNEEDEVMNKSTHKSLNLLAFKIPVGNFIFYV